MAEKLVIVRRQQGNLLIVTDHPPIEGPGETTTLLACFSHDCDWIMSIRAGRRQT